MIAALLTPALSTVDERVEMKEEPVIMEAPPNPCLGYDACTNQDAGGYNANNQVCPTGGSCPTLDLTPYVESDQVTSFYGHVNGFSGCGATTCDDDDVYLLDVPAGYQTNITTAWNSTVRHHTLAVRNADAWTGIGTSGTSIIQSNSCTATASAGTCSVVAGAMAASTIMIYIDCAFSGCQGVNPQDYRLDIEFFFPGDNGNIGDYTEETLVVSSTLLETVQDSFYSPVYQGGATSDTGTFDVVSGQTVGCLLYTSPSPRD